MSAWRLFPLLVTLVLLLLVFVQVYFFVTIRTFLISTNKSKRILRLVYCTFAVFNFPLPLLLFVRPHISALPEWCIYFGVLPFYSWHITLFLLFFLLAFSRIIRYSFVAISWLVNRIKHRRGEPEIFRRSDMFNRQRRVTLQRGLLILAGSAFVGTSLGALRRDKFEISYSSIPIKNLPDGFDNFTIALISDIHSSVFMQKEKMEHYAQVVNSLGADMIAVPGDFVNSMIEEVYPFAEAFSRLNARYGVFGVLGNHDYFTRQVELVAREVNGCGIHLLRNNSITLERQGSLLTLMGIDDTGNSKLATQWVKNISATVPSSSPRILLCHRPYYFNQFALQHVDLTLSGHTHGGQIVFGKLDNGVIAPARIVSPYVSGLYSIGSSSMYVSRGIGTVGIPLRVNCPPEVTKITLVKA